MFKIKKIVSILICVGITSTIFYGCSAKPKSPEEIADEMYQKCNGQGMPSVSVLVAKEGEVFEKSYGLRNVETGEKATPTTNYRLGCITKTFTSMGILLLKEKDLIDLDWTVNKVLTDFPEYAEKITIRNLLQNSSGLPLYQSLWPKNGTTLHDEDVYELIKNNDKLLFQPGLRVDADNDTNFAILALVIEKISGMEYQDFMAENIFKPLGMNNTVAFVEGYNSVPERAYGSVLKDNKFIVEDQYAYSAVLGDGGTYSNVRDLYLWSKAVANNELVSAETMKEAMKTNMGVSDKDYRGIFFSCGWYMEKLYGHKTNFSPGGSIGFYNMFLCLPDEKGCVIILTNYDKHWSVIEDAKKLAVSIM